MTHTGLSGPSGLVWSTPWCASAERALPWPVSKYMTTDHVDVPEDASDVQVIAARFGGGGHRNAAGFTMGGEDEERNSG